MRNININHLSRRKFVGTASALIAGITAGAQPLFNAPSISKRYSKPNSVIKGVQIGVITYSFRNMADQSAEATLKYIVDCGINAIELMGDPAENFAGKPENPVDRRAYFRLMQRQRNGEELTAEHKKEIDDMRIQMNAYNKDVAS